MFGFGTLIFMYYQGLPPLTAFLGSVSTITTIGIYAPDITHMVASEQILLIITFIVSVGLAASIVQSTVTTAMSRELLREQLVNKRIGRLRGHVIVAGYSYLGKYVVEALDRIDIKDRIIIVKDNTYVKSLQSAGLLAVYASTEKAYEILNQIKVQNATSIICTYEDDGDNLLMAMNAKKLNKEIRVVMVAQDGDIVESAKAVGVDIVVPIYDIISQIVSLSAVSNNVVGTFLNKNAHSLHLSEVQIRENQVGQKFGMLNSNPDTPIIMVVRNGSVICNPNSDYELKAGDYLYKVSSSSTLVTEDQNLISASSR
jgi:voltage-gated potassium channel